MRRLSSRLRYFSIFGRRQIGSAFLQVLHLTRRILCSNETALDAADLVALQRAISLPVSTCDHLRCTRRARYFSYYAKTRTREFATRLDAMQARKHERHVIYL